MKLDKKIKYLFVLIAIVILLGSYRCISDMYKVNKIFFDISNSMEIKIDDKSIQELYTREASNKIISIRLKIIQAHIKYQEKKYNESILILKDALLENENVSNKLRNEYVIEKLKLFNYIQLKDLINIEDSFNKVVELAEKNNEYDDLIDIAIKSMKNLIGIKNGTKTAIEIINKVEVLLDKTKDEEKQVELLIIAANIYIIEDRLGQALIYQLDALNIAKINHLQNQIKTILVDLSGNYILQESYTEAINIIMYLIDNYELDTETNVEMLSYLSIAYIQIEKYKQAEDVLDELNIKIEKLDEKLKEANRMWIYTSYADIYNKTGDYNKAKYYLNEATILYNKFKDISFIGTKRGILIEYGDLYYSQGRYEEALKNHINAYNISQNKGTKNEITVLLEAIAEDYYRLGNYKKSKEVIKSVNKMYNQELKKFNEERLKNAYKSIMLDVNNDKIDKLDKNRAIMYVIIIVLVLFIIISYIDINVIRRKNNKINILNNQLKEQSIKDHLTGLYNRRGIREYIYTLEYVDGISKNYAVFMIDVDYFKLYNDNYGHTKGDEVLKDIARCLNHVCENYFVGRYGGEEFILIVNYKNEREIVKLANSIQSAIEMFNIEHKYSKILNRITLSIGICYGNFREGDVNKIIKQSDQALYKSKENGRNRYSLIRYKDN